MDAGGCKAGEDAEAVGGAMAGVGWEVWRGCVGGREDCGRGEEGCRCSQLKTLSMCCSGGSLILYFILVILRLFCSIICVHRSTEHNETRSSLRASAQRVARRGHVTVAALSCDVPASAAFPTNLRSRRTHALCTTPRPPPCRPPPLSSPRPRPTLSPSSLPSASRPMWPRSRCCRRMRAGRIV